MNIRYKVLQEAKKTPKGSHEWKIYQRARNHCTKVLRVAEASYWKDRFRGLSSSSREFWRCINEITGKSKKNCIGPLQDNNGNITTDNNVKCTILNDYFADIGKLEKDPTNSTLQNHVYRITPTISSINYNFYKLNKVFKGVFKPNKAGGHDNVSAKIASMIDEDLLDGLHYVAKTSFHTCKFPTKHKIAKVCCIHKKGSKLKSENYRPISLLCLPGKLLEAVVASEIDSHVHHHQLLSNHQWGFRKGRSPELMLLNMCEKWQNLLKDGKFVGVLLIDFSKAFDSVCHQTLLKKMSAMGISGDVYEWCSSYLNERKQFVTVGDSKSDLKSVDQGVPQGSLLGPRCYSYHANDLPEAAQGLGLDPDPDEGEMFADDLTTYCATQTVDQLTQKIQAISNRLQAWAKFNGMVIHPGKTKIIIVSKKRFIGPVQDVTLNDQSIEFVESHKVLGVTIDNKLSWKTHVDKATKEYNTKVKMLRRMMALGSNVLNKFYFATILPSVTYNIAVWGNCKPNRLETLNAIHAKAARLIHKLPENLSTEESLERVNWMPISYLYKRRLLCLMHKIFNNCIDSDICKMFRPMERRRYNLRRQNQISISEDWSSDNQNSFLSRATKLWNAMPNDLTGTLQHNEFKSKLKKLKSKINLYSFQYNSNNIRNDFRFI